MSDSRYMKKILGLIFCLALILSTFLIIAASGASTIVPEKTIISDETWTQADSPYWIQGDVRVAPDVTLTIEPGVEVWFEGGQ